MLKAGASIRRILVAARAGDLVRGISKRGGAIGGVVVGFDKRSMAIHKTYIRDCVIVGDVLVAGQAVMPGVGPRKAPFGHEPSARGVSHLNQFDVEQVIGAGIDIVDAVVVIAAEVQILVCPKGIGPIRVDSFPTPVHGTLKEEIVAGGLASKPHIVFDQFFVPPPNAPRSYFVKRVIQRRRVLPWGRVVTVRAIHHHRQIDLFKIIKALGLDGAGLGLRQRGQQHGGEDRNDGDDHQQFNQSERHSFAAAGNVCFHIQVDDLLLLVHSP